MSRALWQVAVQLAVVLGALSGARAAAPSARPAPVGAGPVRVHHPAAGVFALHQAQNRLLWLGTDLGACRYDGAQFDCLEAPAALRGRVGALAPTTRGGVWIGLREAGGVFAFDDGVVEAQPPELARPRGVRALLEEDEGLWIGGAAGLALWSGGRLAAIEPTSGLPAGEVRVLARGPDGALWVGGTAGLYRREGRGAARRFVPRLTGRIVQALAFEEGRVWVGTEGHGLLALDGDAPPRAATGYGYSLHDEVLALSRDATGVLWLGTAIGVYRGRGDRFAFVGSEGLSDARAEAILADADASLWVGTTTGGLAQIARDPPVRALGTAEGLAGTTPFAIAADRAGDVWVTSSGGLSRFRGDRFENFSATGALPYRDLRSIAPAADGAVWIGGLGRGLFRYADGRFARIEPATGLPPGGVRTVHETRDGRLLVGLAGGGLAISQDGRGGRFVVHPAAALPCPAEIAVVAEAGGAIFLGTDGGGLCRLTSDGFARVTLPGGDDAAEVFALLGDPDGTLWIGTRRAGLLRLRGGAVARLARAEGLPSAHVAQILDDGAGSLWISTPVGIVRLPRREAEAALGGGASARPVVLGVQDGLRSAHAIWGFAPAGARLADGSLWFPTSNGIAVVPSPARPLAVEVPPVSIGLVSLDGEPRAPGALAGGRLPVGRGNLELPFSVPSFTQRHRLEVHHRLVGLESGWTTSEARGVARYANLPPGRYTFEVVARARGAPETAQQASLSFELLAPWWRTGLFRGAAAALGIAALLGLQALRSWQARQQFRAVLEERQRIARDLHDTLEQSLVAVKLQIEAAEATAEPGGAERLARAATILERTMAEARTSIWALRAGLFGAADLPTALAVVAGQALRGTRVRFDKSVTGEPYRLEPEAEAALARVAQEAITNALKHAAPRHIGAALAFGGEGVTLRVRDDGSGVHPDALASAAETGHHGVLGMRERMTKLGGTLDVAAAAGGGTEVVARVPGRWRRIARSEARG
jgi:signal transduction histidine kinase/ligand-binding sensor domain-containing protein